MYIMNLNEKQSLNKIRLIKHLLVKIFFYKEKILNKLEDDLAEFNNKRIGIEYKIKVFEKLILFIIFAITIFFLDINFYVLIILGPISFILLLLTQKIDFQTKKFLNFYNYRRYKEDSKILKNINIQLQFIMNKNFLQEKLTDYDYYSRESEKNKKRIKNFLEIYSNNRYNRFDKTISLLSLTVPIFNIIFTFSDFNIQINQIFILQIVKIFSIILFFYFFFIHNYYFSLSKFEDYREDEVLRDKKLLIFIFKVLRNFLREYEIPEKFLKMENIIKIFTKIERANALFLCYNKKHVVNFNGSLSAIFNLLKCTECDTNFKLKEKIVEISTFNYIYNCVYCGNENNNEFDFSENFELKCNECNNNLDFIDISTFIIANLENSILINRKRNIYFIHKYQNRAIVYFYSANNKAINQLIIPVFNENLFLLNYKIIESAEKKIIKIKKQKFKEKLLKQFTFLKKQT